VETPREEGRPGRGSRPERAASSPPSSTYRLDALRLEHALATLKREHEKATISRSQRASFTMLQIAAYAIPFAILIIWLVSDTAVGSTKAGTATCFVASAVLGLAVISVLVLVPLNLPLVRKILRQAHLDRQLGLLLPESGHAPPPTGRTPSQDRWLKALAGLFLALVAGSIALAVLSENAGWKLVVALVVFGGPAYFILTRERLPFIALRVGLWLLPALMVVGLILAFIFRRRFGLVGFGAVFVVVLLPALVLVSDRYLSRLRERMRLLEDVDRLRESLSRQRQEAKKAREEFVELPFAEAERLAEVEQAFIRRGRVAAIESARGGTAAGHTLFRTPPARSQIEALDGRTRLLVESQLEELAFEPQPEGAAAGPAPGSWRLAVPETSVEIVYEVADEFRHVRILSVGTSPAKRAQAETPERTGDG
jgi:cell division protein FtsL